MKLLTQNAKLKKQGKYPIWGMALAPHTQSGRNVCPEAGACADICVLWFRGMTVMPNVRDAMKARTDLLFENRDSFFKKLHKELSGRSGCAVRLNTASDLPWEKLDPTIFDHDITFYDYTKIYNRAKNYALGKLPSNYQLTYSWSERSDKRKTNWLLKNGVNVAMVHDTPYDPQRGVMGELPAEIKIGTKWWKTVDGDKYDARLKEVDGEGNVILLRAKIKKDKRDEYIRKRFIVQGNIV